MIIQKEVPITNRQLLKLAIKQAKAKRDDQLNLLTHNAEAVQKKWTVSRVSEEVVGTLIPSFFGGFLVQLPALFFPDSEEGDSENQGPWKQILAELFNIFGKVAQRYV